MINLRVAIPQLDGLKVRGDYYYFAANMAAKMIKVFVMVWKCNRLMICGLVFFMMTAAKSLAAISLMFITLAIRKSGNPMLSFRLIYFRRFCGNIHNGL